MTAGSHGFDELELGLIQPHKAQKPMLRGEVECARAWLTGAPKYQQSGLYQKTLHDRSIEADSSDVSGSEAQWGSLELMEPKRTAHCGVLVLALQKYPDLRFSTYPNQTLVTQPAYW